MCPQKRRSGRPEDGNRATMPIPPGSGPPQRPASAGFLWITLPVSPATHWHRTAEETEVPQGRPRKSDKPRVAIGGIFKRIAASDSDWEIRSPCPALETVPFRNRLASTHFPSRRTSAVFSAYPLPFSLCHPPGNLKRSAHEPVSNAAAPMKPNALSKSSNASKHWEESHSDDSTSKST